MLRRRSRGLADSSGHLGRLEYGLDRDPARSLQRQPDGFGLPACRTEPVTAARILEMQMHPDSAVLPDQARRLHQDALAIPEIPDKGIARSVQQQQSRA